MKRIERFNEISFLEYGTFAVLALFALFFFEERLHADSAWYAFQLINTETLHAEHGRFILYLSQLLPWLFIKLNFGLRPILIAYSLNHVVFPFLIFLICKYIFKHKTAGLLLIALQLVSVGKGFFCPMFEMYYTSYLLVLAAVILQSEHKYKHYFIVPLFIIICTGHPLAFLLALLVLAYRFLEVGSTEYKTIIAYSLLIALVYYAKSFFVSEYDVAKQAAFYDTLKNASYDDTYLFNLLKMLGSHYWGILCLFIISVASLMTIRKPATLLLFIISFFGMLALVNISYYGFHVTRYQEQVYFPLNFITSFPLFFYVSPSINSTKQKAILGLFLFLVVARIVNLNVESEFFENRTSEIKEQIDIAKNKNLTKAIVKVKQLSYPTNWSYPLESLLISSSSGPSNSVILATDEDYFYNENNRNLKMDEYILRKWEILPISQLNASYFQIDSSAYYMFQ